MDKGPWQWNTDIEYWKINDEEKGGESKTNYILEKKVFKICPIFEIFCELK